MSKVILKDSIRKLGRIGDVVSVKDGYAFNFLIPRNKAIPATAENLARLESQKSELLKQDQKNKENAEKIAKTIPQNIFLARDINENGLLYGTISAKDIITQIPTVTDKHAITLKPYHIHNYGVYDVTVELHHDVVLNLKLSISDSEENAKKQLINSAPSNQEESPKKKTKTSKNNTDSNTQQESSSEEK